MRLPVVEETRYRSYEVLVAGMAAAMAACDRLVPRAVDVSELCRRLQTAGVIV